MLTSYENKAMQHAPEPLLVGVTEAARLLSVSPRTIWALTKEGKLHSIRIGRAVRYSYPELHAFVQGCKSGTDRRAPITIDPAITQKMRDLDCEMDARIDLDK